MRRGFVLLLSALPLLAQAEACIVHSQGAQVDVKVCQQNRSIPASLFHNGFCQPQLAGQKVEVTYTEQCPRLRCGSLKKPPTRPWIAARRPA